MPKTGSKVTFVSPGSQVAIRFMFPDTRTICEAARDLKATHFIAREGEAWGLFEMRYAQKDTPLRGEWTVRDPVKTFPLDALDAAVMFALATGATA